MQFVLSALTCLLVLSRVQVTDAMTTYGTKYLVDNLNRDVDNHMRVGDLIQVTFRPCVSCSLVVTDWIYPETGVTLVETTNDNYTATFKFSQEGNFPISVSAEDSQGQTTTQDMILINVHSSVVRCHIWRTCFTFASDENVDSAECLTLWTAMSSAIYANLTLRIWLGHATDVMRVADEPFYMTEEETILTEEMYLLGEEPRAEIIKGPLRGLTDSVVVLQDADDDGVARATFDAEGKFWKIDLYTNLANTSSSSMLDFAGGTLEIKLQGQSVNTMGCSAESRELWLDLPKYIFSEMDTSLTIPEENLTSAEILAQDICSPTIILESSSSSQGAWMIQGLLASATSNAPSIEYVAAHASGADILSVAATRLGIVFLHQSGLSRVNAVLSQNQESSHVAQSLHAEISGLGLTHLAAPMACDWVMDHKESTRNDILAAWNGNSSDVSEVYFLKFESNSTSVHVESVSLDGMYTILQVLPLVSAAKSVVLVYSSTSSQYSALIVNEISGTVSALASLPSGLGSNLKIASPIIPDGNLILWSGRSLYFSPSGGMSWRRIIFATYDLAISDFVLSNELEDENDEVVQVVTAISGEYIIRTKYGRLYKGMFGLVKAVEIYSPFLSNDPTLSWVQYRPDGSLLGLFGGPGHNVQVVEIAEIYKISTSADTWNSTLLQALDFSTALKCPYLEWDQLPPTTDSFYADMNDEIESTTILTYDASIEGMHIAYQTSDRFIMDMEASSETVLTSANGKLLHRRRTVQAVVPPETSSRTGVGLQAQASGKVVVRAAPTRFTQTCEHPTKMLQIHVGCPRGRHLRYSPPSAYSQPASSVVSSECKSEAESASTDDEADAIKKECTCRKYKDYTITLPRDIVNETRLRHQASLTGEELSWSEDDVSYKFDMDTYDCPTFIPYTYSFKPGLEIWDGDTKVKDVDADFVVFEMNGREDYTYGLTASNVACLRRPDTWDEKLAADPNITTAWGSHNHQSCFVIDSNSSESSSAWGDLPYEILNASDSNYVSFKNTLQKDAPYEFIAIVVDPDYSFCTLHAYFSVEPYGIPIDAFTTFIIIFCVVMCSMLMLACTYFMHRREILASVHNRDQIAQSKKVL